MNERSKLDLGEFQPEPARPDLQALRAIGDKHGFVSRDPAPAAPEQPAQPKAANFRRPGRPPSDRMIPINVRVNDETAERIYRLRDAKPRQGMADVIEAAMQVYDDHLSSKS